MPTVGIDLGGTKCLGVVIDAHGSVVNESRADTPQGGDAIVDTLVAVVSQVVGERQIDGVGIGVPGLVNAEGVLRFAPNLPGVVELNVAARVGARVGRHVLVDNDANCAAWAERCVGAGRGRDHAILVTLGTGIGGGLVLGGQLHRGANGFAGEIGHMVVDPDGPECPCGQRGCWERFASGSGLGRLARDAGFARAEDVTAGATRGDAAARSVMASFGWWVALGLANLANAFDPEVFVLGGGLVEAGDVLLDPVRASFADLVEAADHRPRIEIVAAELGEHAGAIGAALLARP